jgi:4-hydroxy-tetrahydrodipicolinate reductase
LTAAAPLRLALYGATGRMGQSIVKILRGEARWRLAAAIASAGSERLGQDVAAEGAPLGICVANDVAAALGGATVAVDFSAAAAVGAHAQACALAQVPLLVGATGLDQTAQQSLQRAAERIAVLVAPNTSIAVGVLTELAVTAARRLGPEVDIQIVEAHHRDKRDAPSGTALALRRAIEQGAARRTGEIGIAVVRAGDVVGEHTVIFAAAGERLELIHRATDRLVFARGALRAAEWLVGKPAGLYSMRDVLNQA